MNQSINLKCTCALLLIPLLLVCFGLAPMAQAVGPDTDGTIPGSNNGEGIGVLVSRTAGVWNTGTGFEALSQLTAGNQNTATGLRALFSDTNGGFNTATGVFSLFSNTSGFFNSATGAYSLANNINGSNNTANGYGALYRNTADGNTATGFAALYHNTEGAGNTAIGLAALASNTTGNQNTAIGPGALVDNTFGNNTTAIGYQALVLNTTGNGNTALGYGAGSNVTTADNVICIGHPGLNATNSCFIGQIFGVTSSGGTAVLINSDGKLGTTTSSRRFKDAIKPMDKASEAILALKPVTFRYKQEIDPARSPQFGLVAEDVEAVDPDLVVRDGKGKVNTVRYEAVNAMLLNEFLKEHRKGEEQEAAITQLKSIVSKQEAIIAQQQKGMEVFAARLDQQSAQIQKASAYLAAASPSRGGLEMTKSAPQVVSTNP